MKSRILSLIITAFIAGCAATPDGVQRTITPQAVNQIARFAAQASASEVLASKPESRADLIKSKQILSSLVAGKQWDIAALASAFQQAGFKVLNGQRGILVVSGAILAADLSGRQVDLKQSDYAEAAILGALDGLNIALK